MKDLQFRKCRKCVNSFKLFFCFLQIKCGRSPGTKFINDFDALHSVVVSLYQNYSLMLNSNADFTDSAGS